jgi:glyoxylase-like metal-dependent hydrolase (beta-lactamase superfamily II)
MESRLVELAEDIRRVTFPLPLGIDHVHCYLLRDGDGTWTIVDTGLGLPGAGKAWQAVLDELDAPVGRIVVSHFHPDHVGGAAIVAELTGAPVYQGAIDHAQCVRAWGRERSLDRLTAFMVEHGLPIADAAGFRIESEALASYVQVVDDPELLEPGERIDGWEILHLPGHADGHLALLRDGVLIAGDTILATISPVVGLYADARPDPLGDFLSSLARIVELAPTIAYTGHRAAIDDPAARARELTAHHVRRLELTADALVGAPVTAYEISHALFPDALSDGLRRFALAEALAHVEHLVGTGAAERVDAGPVRYAAARGPVA